VRLARAGARLDERAVGQERVGDVEVGVHVSV